MPLILWVVSYTQGGTTTKVVHTPRVMEDEEVSYCCSWQVLMTGRMTDTAVDHDCRQVKGIGDKLGAKYSSLNAGGSVKDWVNRSLSVDAGALRNSIRTTNG